MWIYKFSIDVLTAEMSIINVIVLGLPILICISGVIGKPKSWYDGAARRPHFDPFSGQRNVWFERDALDRLDDEYNAERVARKLTYEDDFDRAFDALLQKEEESKHIFYNFVLGSYFIGNRL